MDSETYDKLTRDVRHASQKYANDIFTQRRTIILSALRQQGVPLSDEPMSIKKGRPKK